MKVTFDIPKWAFGKTIHIFAGTELLANKEFRREKNKVNGKIEVKEHYLPLKIKSNDERCNGCGDCCNTGLPMNKQQTIDLTDRLLKYLNKDDFTKPCPILNENGCSLGPNIPFGCIRSVCSDFDNCTERLIELEVI